jgi:hypothetical protein
VSQEAGSVADRTGNATVFYMEQLDVPACLGGPATGSQSIPTFAAGGADFNLFFCYPYSFEGLGATGTTADALNDPLRSPDGER